MPRVGRVVLPDYPHHIVLHGQEAVQRGLLTGTDHFVEQVETILGKRIENRSRGRPQSMSALGCTFGIAIRQRVAQVWFAAVRLALDQKNSLGDRFSGAQQRVGSGLVFCLSKHNA